MKRSSYRRQFFFDNRGQGLAEYIIIVVLVAVIVLLGLRYFGVGVSNQFSDAKQKLDSVAEGESQDAASTESDEGVAQGSITGDEERHSDNSQQVAPRGNVDGSGGDEDIAALAASVSKGVGDEDVVTPPLRVSFSSLLTLFVVIVAIGVFLLVRFARKSGGVKKAKKKKKATTAQPNESGQAMVEFVLSVITFLFCILGVIQLALCLNAYTLVRYAAYNAARAAIVHEADEDVMREAARLSLLPIFPRHGRADHQRGLVENYLGAVVTDQMPNNLFTFRPITDVRILPRDAAPSGSIVTFDDPADAPAAIITAEVTHHYELVIPLVNRILFFLYRRWVQSFKTAEWDSNTMDNLAAVTDRERRSSTGSLHDIEYRIPIVAHYTMRMQSDMEAR